MKTMSTVAMLCLAFWAGGHFIIVPRLEQAAAGQQGKPQTHTKSIALDGQVWFVTVPTANLVELHKAKPTEY